MLANCSPLNRRQIRTKRIINLLPYASWCSSLKGIRVWESLETQNKAKCSLVQYIQHTTTLWHSHHTVPAIQPTPSLTQVLHHLRAIVSEDFSRLRIECLGRTRVGAVGFITCAWVCAALSIPNTVPGSLLGQHLVIRGWSYGERNLYILNHTLTIKILHCGAITNKEEEKNNN